MYLPLPLPVQEACHCSRVGAVHHGQRGGIHAVIRALRDGELDISQEPLISPGEIAMHDALELSKGT